MAGAVRIRDDYCAADLRRLAKTYRDPRQIQRLLALAAVYDGMSGGGGEDRRYGPPDTARLGAPVQ